MNVHAPSTKALFARHLIAYPLAGCAVAVSMFAAVVRPNLSGEPWLLDLAAILCGTLGVVVGGMLGFAAPMRQRTVAPALHLWTVAPAALSVLLIVVVTGVPAVGVAVTAASAAVCLLAVGARRRRRTTRVSQRDV